MLTHGLASNTWRRSVGMPVVGRQHGIGRERSIVAGRSQRDLPLRVVSGSDLTTGGSTSAVVVGCNLGLDAASIGSGADLRKNGANGLHQAEFLMGSGKFKSRLDDIVGKGIAKKSLHLAGGEHLLHNHVLGRSLSTAQALLNHIGAELVAR